MSNPSNIQTMMFKIPKGIDLGGTLHQAPLPGKWESNFDGVWPSPDKRRGGRVPYSSLGNSLRLLFPTVAHVEPMNRNLTRRWLSCWEQPGEEQFMSLLEAWIRTASRDKNLSSISDGLQWDDLEWTCQNISFGVYGSHDNGSPLLDPDQYECLPDLICAELAGREIDVGGRSLIFRRAYDGRRPCLISWPAIESSAGQSHWYWSYALTPKILSFTGYDSPVLSLSVSIRRWASNTLKSESGFYNLPFRENTTVYVESLSSWFGGTSNERGHNLVGLAIKKEPPQDKDDVAWKPGWTGTTDEVLSRLGQQLPHPVALAEDPVRFLNRELGSAGITLRGWDTRHKVTTGVPLLDRRDIFAGVSAELVGFGLEPVELSRRVRLQAVRRKSPLRASKYTDIPGKDVVESLRNTVGDRITIEVLHQSDSMREALRSEIWTRLLNEEGTSVPTVNRIDLGDVSVTVNFRELGALGAELTDRGRAGEERRAEEVGKAMDSVDVPVGCLVELHDSGYFSSERDPKSAIRRGLATTGRLSQFITPPKSDEKSESYAKRAQSAVADLLRQMGNMPGPPFDEMYAKSGFPKDLQVLGIWVLQKERSYRFPALLHLASPRQIEGGISPIRIMLPTGLRGGEWYTYGSGQLSIGSGLVPEIPRDRVPSVLKRMLGEFTESTDVDDVPVLMLFDAQNVRPFWPESHNRNLVAGARAGMPWNTGGLDPRVARIHSGEDEMPQWYEESLKWSSGLFKGLGKQSYFSVGPKSVSMKSGSQRNSKRDRPRDRHTLSRAIEIAIVQMQEGDDLDMWAGAVHRQREMASHYNDVLELPLALHLAKKTEEYISGIPRRSRRKRGGRPQQYRRD